jgi:type IV fimbrial biogenesis protein FimT
MTPKTPHRHTLGFTLVESLVALAITSTLASVALPNLKGFSQGKASETSASALGSALRLAKSEAMKRGEQVTVCAREAGLQHTCAASGKDWSAGWIVFVDRERRGKLEDGDLILQVHQPVQNAPKVVGTLHHITYQGTGVALNAASHFDFLPGGKANAAGARRGCVSHPGRLRVLPSVTDCAA